MIFLLLLKTQLITDHYPERLFNIISVFTKRTDDGTFYLNSALMPNEYLSFKYYGSVEKYKIKIRQIPSGSAILDPTFIIDIRLNKNKYEISVAIIPNSLNCFFHYMGFFGYVLFLFVNEFSFNIECLYFTICVAIALTAEMIIILRKKQQMTAFIKSLVK